MKKNTSKSNVIRTVMPSVRVSAEAAREKAILSAVNNKNNSRLVENSILYLLETNLLRAAL